MKKYLSIIILIGIAGTAQAVSFNEKPYYDVAVSTTVSISTSAWTRVPTGTNSSNRLAIQVSNPATNNAAMVGLVSKSAPTEATTIRPIEIQAGENPVFRLSSNLYLYLLSLHTSAENVHAQEYLSR